MQQSDRKYWVEVMQKIIDPVLISLSEKKLKQNMPIECFGGITDRHYFTYLEAIGRTLAGISPWLESKCKDNDEEMLRQKYALISRQAIDSATDPNSPDYLNSTYGDEIIVHMAFLANAIVRAPNELCYKLEPHVKQNLIIALKSTRLGRKPIFNNWLLFSAMIETALFVMGEVDWDLMRIDYAIKQHEQWYLGDGAYSDGPDFHWDYYNGFVIQPMLVDIIKTIGKEHESWSHLTENIILRERRYAAIQERLISPEGTYPLFGRSITYRFGAFQALSQIVLMELLPGDLSPAQVRCGLTAIIKRIFESDGLFDENGWLKIGVCGSQPSLAEPYISTGSLYLCCAVFLPLGLPDDNRFWSGEKKDWTSKKLWKGIDATADHSIR